MSSQCRVWTGSDGFSAQMPQVMSCLVLALTLTFFPGCNTLKSPDTGSGGNPPGDTSNTSGPDPLFKYQWHLSNTGGNANLTSGEDVNVLPVWATGNRGEGVVIAVVDDGLDIRHEDLKDNVLANLCYNFSNGTTDPGLGDSGHGTAVAGVAAALDNNSKGGRGVAPRASLVGYNFLDVDTNSAMYDSMTRNLSRVSIVSNSWGSGPGCSGQISPSSQNPLLYAAIEHGLASGRGGKGISYLWAAGNGGNDKVDPSATLFLGCTGKLSLKNQQVDNANYDGYSNFYGAISVGAIGSTGKKAGYSNRGANLWVSAHSWGDNYAAITTTDVTGSGGLNETQYLFTGSPILYGYTNTQTYTNFFSGTSSATPLVSGVVALMLNANPNLTWRDVKLILAESARKNDPSDTAEWVSNGAGWHVNHKYGFGAVDANAAVTKALSWVSVGGTSSLTVFPTPSTTPVTETAPLTIHPNPSTIPSNIPFTSAVDLASTPTGVSFIEYIDVEVDFNSRDASNNPRAGDFDIQLISPSGTTSNLVEHHLCFSLDGSGEPDFTRQTGCDDPQGWRFGTSRHLGEAASGTWTLKITDNKPSATTRATLNSWGIRFYGH